VLAELARQVNALAERLHPEDDAALARGDAAPVLLEEFFPRPLALELHLLRQVVRQRGVATLNTATRSLIR